MRFLRFNLVGALGVGVQLAALAALVAAGVHHLPATVAAVAAAIGHNFLWHWWWTWRDRTVAGVPPGRALGRFVLANGCVSLAGNVVLMAALVDLAGLPPVAANALAIAACGLVNYRLGDTLVFARAPGALVVAEGRWLEDAAGPPAGAGGAAQTAGGRLL